MGMVQKAKMNLKLSIWHEDKVVCALQEKVGEGGCLPPPKKPLYDTISSFWGRFFSASVC